MLDLMLHAEKKRTLVLTTLDAPSELIATADVDAVTEMRRIKHVYTTGRKALVFRIELFGTY